MPDNRPISTEDLCRLHMEAQTYGTVTVGKQDMLGIEARINAAEAELDDAKQVTCRDDDDMNQPGETLAEIVRGIMDERNQYKAARDAAIAQLSAEARLRGSTDAERDRYQEADRIASSQLLSVMKERDRYKAVVERLPKTADGVPVVPGYTSVHRVNRFGSCGTYHLMSLDCGRWVLSCDSRIKVSDCYSTPEAALQATNAERQEDTDAK